MKKHGFNENELVKTVVDMVDKDGFHKQVVNYGKSMADSSEMKVSMIEMSADGTDLAIKMIAVNVPSSHNVYFAIGQADSDFSCDVGETLDTRGLDVGETNLSDIKAVYGILYTDTPQTETSINIYAYAVDRNFKVVARAMCVRSIGSPK